MALACGSLAFLGAHYCVEKRGFNLTFTITNVLSIAYGILVCSPLSLLEQGAANALLWNHPKVLFPAQWATFSPMLIFYAVCRQFVNVSVMGYLESVYEAPSYCNTSF